MMKCVRACVAAVILVLAGPLLAQESQKEPLVIDSDYFEFISGQRMAVFKGNVVVKDPPETQIRCQVLTVMMSTNNTRVESITAEGNVVIDMVDKEGKKTATGKHATFDVASNILTLTGEPSIQTSFGTLKDAEKVILDRGKGVMKTIGRNRMTIDPASLEAQRKKDSAGGDKSKP